MPRVVRNMPGTLVLIACGTMLSGQTVTAQVEADSAEQVAAGAALYQQECVLCHGGDGTGGRGPDLTQGVFRRASTDQQLYDILQGDLWESDMPWFGFNERETWQVVAYVRSLSGERGPVPGDPARGRDLFFGAAGCATCHWASGRGSRQGPDLSWIGWRRSPAYLRTAILDPAADVDPRWWRAEATTSDGQQMTGYLIAEDLLNVRILDPADRLHQLPKSALTSLSRLKTSSMPPPELGEDDLTDLIAFLAALRGGGDPEP